MIDTDDALTYIIILILCTKRGVRECETNQRLALEFKSSLIFIQV